MAVIPLSIAAIVGAVVALISPIIAMWVAAALWGSTAWTHRLGFMILALGFTSGLLPALAIRLGFMVSTGGVP